MMIWFQLANVRLTNLRPTLASLAASDWQATRRLSSEARSVKDGCSIGQSLRPRPGDHARFPGGSPNSAQFSPSPRWGFNVGLGHACNDNCR